MITLYNTLTKKKEAFIPLEKGLVGMYTCGPTVYGKIHIGNIRSYLMADTLKRVLLHEGYTVTHIKNITDVGHLTRDTLSQGDSGEDKIEMQAKREHKTPKDIAHHYEEYFHNVEKRMHILVADRFPRATEHIPQMIAMIETLIASGHAYTANGNVFLDVTTFDHYGALSGNTLEKLKTGARLEPHPDKRHAWDFALWLKAPKDHLMQWESPWGMGYPGWHIECSAMSTQYLGTTFDIHTGGEDNIFPHHEAEIAQSECATKKPFVRYWIHTRHLLFEGEKMSKSKGTFLTLEDVETKGFSPADLRLALLSSHYRSQMNFSWDTLRSARKHRKRIEETIERLREFSSTTTFKKEQNLFESYKERFVLAIHDDLNIPQALSEVYAFISQINALLDSQLSQKTKEEALALWEEMNAVLGLPIERVSSKIPENVQVLLSQRQEARSQKNFPRSDMLREEIEKLGYILKDTPQGQEIREK